MNWVSTTMWVVPMIDSENEKSGFALVAVLAFLTLFALFLAPFATASRIRALTVNNRFETLKFDLAAQAINAMLAGELVAQPGLKQKLLEASRRWPLQCKIGNIPLTLQVLDQASLIDINKATPELIAAGFIGLGLSPANAEATARAVVAFRSVQISGDIVPDHIVPANGMKHGPFEDLTELNEFGSLREVPMQRLTRVFTLFNPSGNLLDRSLDPSLEEHLDAGQTTPSSGTFFSSQVLSIETNLGTGGANGSDHAVVVIDNSNKTFNRLASLQSKLEGTGASTNAVPCTGIIGGAIPTFVQQSLNR